jgi:hypothetical protein
MPIDSTGQLADGTPLHGAADLRQAVLSRSEAFMTVATEKLLIYALGRPLHATDMSTVREIVRAARAQRPEVLSRSCSASSKARRSVSA